MEFTTEFFQTCLRASIYRLQESEFVSDLNFLGAIWTIAKDVRRTTVRSAFQIC